MAANRNLQTSFWDDRYVASLPVEHRYLYLYLKLNKYIQTSGCCELKLWTMIMETGLSIEAVREGLDRLQEDGKIRYEDDWLAVRGETQDKGKKLQAASELQLSQAPLWVAEFLIDVDVPDERAKHPAIAVIRDLTERFPAKKDWDTIIELLGENFDEEYLRECHAEWSRRGYNPRGTAWYTDWYVNRSKPGGRRTDINTLKDYYKEFTF